MKRQIQKILNKLGFKVMRYPDEIQKRRLKLFEIYGINSVIDVGANVGQYASELRRDGYKGKIISFEPLQDVFLELQKQSQKDEYWESLNIALGDRDENTQINVSNNIVSSSLLEIKGDRIKADNNEIFYTGIELIKIKRLDSIFNEYFNPKINKIFLKIDAQGFESKIIDGAVNSLEFIDGIQLEMSLVELYNGEMLFLPMINKLSALGFSLKGIELGFHNPDTMELYQVDGIFFRNK